MTSLAQESCAPIPTGTLPLTRAAAVELLAQLCDWTMDTTGGEISRTFHFKDYYETMAFVNALAGVAHREDHHPELEISYNRCRVRFSTHSVNGLSRNDFVCAAKIDVLSGT